MILISKKNHKVLNIPINYNYFVFMQEVDMNYIAKVTHGFSGADLTEICQRVSVIKLK